MRAITDAMVCAAYMKSKEIRSVALKTPHSYYPTAIWPLDILVQETRRPADECLSAIRRAIFSGYVECRFSLRSGWLTPAGLDLLNRKET